jgi:exosortase A-associated hydrolase 2
MPGARAAVEPFFMPLAPGHRFCLLHRPAPALLPRGAVLYVHPFAEEMNKSRRMAALASRRLAGLGYAVLQIDLYGCGDSSGEIVDATVSQWRADIQAAADWMLARGLGPLTLWGLRFGALLALDWSRRTGTAHERVLLWQPVASGDVHLTQFLRIGVAVDMMTASGSGGGSGLRNRLAGGETVEVAGYDVTPALQREMDSVKITGAMAKGVALEWFDVVQPTAEELPVGSRRTMESLRDAGATLRTHRVEGDPFWSTVETVDCPALIESTCAVMSERAR